MTQHFGRRTSTVFRLAVLGLPVLVAASLVAGALYWRSDAAWGVGEPAAQPIPFQHDLHVAGLGGVEFIDRLVPVPDPAHLENLGRRAQAGGGVAVAIEAPGHG